MDNRIASETSLGTRGKTALTVGCGAGPAADMLQHSVVSDGASGVTPRNITARIPSINLEKAGSVPRFLVIERIDEGNFDKVSPFVIAKQLFGLVGDLKTIKKTKEGLLVETVSEAQACRLLKLEKLGIYSTRTRPHKTLNFSKGVVSCPDFLNCTTDEILEELQQEGVIEVKRIMTKRDGRLIQTASHILTFNKPKLPIRIKAAFYCLEVRPYIPNPIRCFKCQRFGHISSKCSSEALCACGKPPHTGNPCQDPMKCVNCGGLHSARSKNCPKMVEEIAIQNIKVKERISYTDARRKVAQSNRTAQVPYSQVVATNKESIAKSILQELMPDITKAIEEQIQNSFTKVLDKSSSLAPKQIPKTPQTTDMGPPTEKRKRNEFKAMHEDSFDSDESSTLSQTSSLSCRGKKKKGWPKGKARKPPDPSGETSVNEGV